MKTQSMDEYKRKVRRVSRFSVIALIFFVVGAITPYSSIFLGLALGTFVGLFNTILTARKVNQIGELALSKNIHNKKKYLFSGMLSRFAAVFIAVMLAYQFPLYIHFFSTMIGLFIPLIVMIVDGVVLSNREQK